jgi:acyl-CoA thioesterase FadM
LTLFGLANSYLTRKDSGVDFEQKFLSKANNFKFALLFYQFLAVTLTLYATLKYITLPLQIFSILVCTMFIGAVIFLGEEFPISRIKYSHAVFSLIILTSLLVLLNSTLFNPNSSLISAAIDSSSGTLQLAIKQNPLNDWILQAYSYQPLYNFRSNFAIFLFWIPVLIGFVCGPWLDLQNWQRVIQIKKENSSVAISYILAGLFFWFLIMIDGMLAIACYERAQNFIPTVLEGISNYDTASLFYSVKSIITRVLSADAALTNLLAFYTLFIGLASLATYDSYYIAYKWYTNEIIKDSKNIIFSFIPSKLVSSPVPLFFSMIVTATITLHFSEFGRFVAMFDQRLQKFFNFELEYYIAFFASFFIVYAVAFYRSLYTGKNFSALKLFATALASVAVFGIGYFSENISLMAIASLLPFVYAMFINGNNNNNEVALQTVSTELITPQLIDISSRAIYHNTNIPKGAQGLSLKGCYIQDGWFSHQFIPTYQDTNSVGNVYFAMYLMWVGKTRELFFTHVVPEFNPKTSSYLILTRGIEHKFVKEIKEFDEVVIQIRIADYNRKFVTLEHRILDAHGDLVGKGKQNLMFVDSESYALIDLPQQIQQGFIPYVTDKKSSISISEI